MSSWRKLMTPLNEKYEPQESSSASSLVQSNFGKISTLLKNKDQYQESLQTTTTYNDKLKTLHNQMSKLKGELSKYSTTRGRDRPTKTLSKINKTLGDELSPEHQHQRINLTQETYNSPIKIAQEDLVEDEDEELQTNSLKDRHRLQSDFLKVSTSSVQKYIMQDSLSPKSLMDDPFSTTLDNKSNSSKVIFADDIQEKETTRYPQKSHAKTLSILKNAVYF